ncbi:MAG TPA: heterodisulfide reductase-related iron-sulfur binding cluster [Humisphaera sp.]|nr:heterodisulfide reductase-related iron-sulfur binding cluster [Humisphaera sp.]
MTSSPPALPVLEKPPAEQPLAIDRRAYERGLSCVHCGLCLPACPTYAVTGLEADSPRGRIQLMLGLADGKIPASDSVRRHLDLCLDCRGCETACPSGVVYHELIEETRSRLAESQTFSVQGRFMRWLFFNVFTRPTRLKLALLPARILQKTGVYSLLRKSGVFKLLPTQLRKMEQMLTSAGPLWPVNLPARISHSTSDLKTDRALVGFFAGCIGSVMFEKVNRQAVELLSACGADVISPPAQNCCGAIHLHGGQGHPAEAMARRNIDVFLPAGEKGVDFIVTTVAGCGAMLREYDVLLRDDPQYADRAKQFVSRVRDISETLLDLGLPEMRFPINETATYHDACHLAHAQKVTTAPRILLQKIPGLKLVPLPESDMCCGAAGTYNLTEPEMSTKLAERKLKNIESTGAGVCATGNVGCAMQIQSQADAEACQLSVVHPVELLHRAVFGLRIS